MKILLSFIVLALSITFSNAQLTTPPSGNSQKCMVTQYIGSIANVSITYNSPSVRGREGAIWGQLVPWGLAPNSFGTSTQIPWRMGANENTVFTTSHDIQVNGKDLKAGSYGLHTIPVENGPWTLIFSKTIDAWGSYYYDSANDALRIEVTPSECEFTEFLSFQFISRGEEETTAAMKWEKLILPFTISIENGKDLYVAKMREELKGNKGFSWQNYIPAINYCVANSTNLDEALQWADMAIGGNFIGQKNFATLSAKAQVLMAMGKMMDASALMDEAIRIPGTNANQVHNYGRQLIAAKQGAKALEIMKFNYDKNEGAWPTAVGMMRAESANGNFKEAAKFAKLAIEQAPDSLNKNFLEGALTKLQNGEDIN